MLFGLGPLVFEDAASDVRKRRVETSAHEARLELAYLSAEQKSVAKRWGALYPYFGGLLVLSPASAA